jgi:hypothetical protein
MNTSDTQPKLYSELAGWWQLFSRASDYADEASLFTRLLNERTSPPPVTLLELGSGGGNNASHMKAHFTMTLCDLSPAMVESSRALNPECDHCVGDMRTVRLGLAFDGVFIHDAIMYMTTEDDLSAAIQTAAAHCRPGGTVLIAPDWVAETFAPATRHGGHDAADGHSMRYLEWIRDPDPADCTVEVDFACLLRAADGSLRVEHDRHVFGVFPRATWLRLHREAELDPAVTPDPFGRELFLSRKRA